MRFFGKVIFTSLILSLLLVGCGGSGGGEEEDNDDNLFSISGTIKALEGEIHLILKKDTLDWNSGIYNGNGVADITFTIGEFEAGVAYSVEVVTSPSNQVCTVENGSGTVVSTVSDILVTCESLPEPQTGTFIDSPVEGLSYFTDSFSGQTLEDGSFDYMSGETVTFVMGSTQFSVEQLAEGAIISPLDVFSAQDTADRRVVNLARLLQTLDSSGSVDDGLNLRTTLIAEHGPAINFDVSTDEFGSDASILAFAQAANPDVNIQALVTAEEAKQHLDSQLALIENCALDRVFELTSHETVIPNGQGVAGSNYSLHGASLSISKAGVCSLVAPEGWSSSCSISGSSITTTVDDSTVLSGTLANNSVTLVAMPILSSADDGTPEYVSVYFNGSSSVACPVEEIAAGTYSYMGKEAVSQLDGSGEEVYDVTGTITIGDESCEVVSTEGDFSCQVIGNEIFGLGEASGLKGTITNNRVTLYFNSPNSEGELVVGYFNGVKETE